MDPRLYWIRHGRQGHLGIMARPRGDDWLPGEVRALREAGVDVVVSLLTREEARELGLTDEGRLCEAAGMRFQPFPIADRQVPRSMSQAGRLIGELHQELLAGARVVIHCRAGIGRAAVIAASVLVAAGIPPAEALRLTAEARGCLVPDTEEQAAWVESFQAFRRLTRT